MLFIFETQISYARDPSHVENVVGRLKLLLSSGVQLVTAERVFTSFKITQCNWGNNFINNLILQILNTCQ